MLAFSDLSIEKQINCVHFPTIEYVERALSIDINLGPSPVCSSLMKRTTSYWAEKRSASAWTFSGEWLSTTARTTDNKNEQTKVTLILECS